MSKVGEIFEKFRQHFEQKLPFVVYNKPHAPGLIGIFQYDDWLHTVKDFDEKGFVFAPFHGGEMVLIPACESEILIADFKRNPISKSNFQPEMISDDEVKNEYQNLVQKAIDAIDAGDFEKVVLSRKERVNIVGFDAVAVFQQLLDEYPEAFVYCFFHPKTGLWFGAFSEKLLKMNNLGLQTMAVAGTQPFQENLIWGAKEKEEQRIVTDFIIDNLQDAASDIRVSEPYTLKAGSVAHIKTDIAATLNPGSDLGKVLGILHPTPAVCGFPKQEAKDFILKNEGYNREYYSGFFGEFNTDFTASNPDSDLYVNLRCMKVDRNHADVYVGGGVTRESDPEKEWLETVNKTMTMKKILHLENDYSNTKSI